MQDVGGQPDPRILMHEEMKNINHVWQEEFFNTSGKQERIARDQEQDRGKPKKQKKTHDRKHSRFNLMIRRTYGNKAVALLIVQMERFNASLMDGIADALEAHRSRARMQDVRGQ